LRKRQGAKKTLEYTMIIKLIQKVYKIVSREIVVSVNFFFCRGTPLKKEINVPSPKKDFVEKKILSESLLQFFQ
jgi:hypothetical protein